MGIFKEFKEFAIKGNLIDMAVAFVMASAFGKVVSAFIDGMIMPAVGMVTGGTDFNDKLFTLKEGAPEIKDATGTVISPAVEAVAIKWGTFLTVTIEFLIIAWVVFIIIKSINKMKKAKEEVPAPKGPSQEELLTEIRDLLKK